MKAQKGFTLVELVVVIAILGVLAAVAIPRVNEFLRQATEQSYIADLAIIQSAVSAWYSDLHNDPFLGSRQYPIIGRNETSQDGRITRGEAGVEGVDEVGPFDHKDDGSPLAPTGTLWEVAKELICCTWGKTAPPRGTTTGTAFASRAKTLGPPLKSAFAAMPISLTQGTIS